MPNGDGTGPLGEGPMTGRGFGWCVHGMRRGFGMGFGFRNEIPNILTDADEKQILEAQLKQLETEKQAIERRLKELK